MQKRLLDFAEEAARKVIPATYACFVKLNDALLLLEISNVIPAKVNEFNDLKSRLDFELGISDGVDLLLLHNFKDDIFKLLHA